MGGIPQQQNQTMAHSPPPQAASSSVSGVPIRSPFPGEMEYFKKNPNVAGMAAEDNKIILNPFSKNSEDQQKSVAANEAARVWMRTKKEHAPSFRTTPQQDKYLDSTTYKNASEQDRRDTIAARIISGDSSAGKPTQDQLDFVEILRSAMSAGR